MEFEPKKHTPRVSRLLSGSTGTKQKIAFFDNRTTNTQSTIQLCKKIDISKPYDKYFTDDLITMGREVECDNVGLVAAKGTLVNGHTLARSSNCLGTTFPFIDLQVEGQKRGTRIIEVVYGPVKGSFYTSITFTTVRMMLYDTLEMASNKKLPLITAIRLFNYQVMSIKDGEKYVLTPSSVANNVTLASVGTSNKRVIQTNLSLPFSILSATDRSKPMMEDLIPVEEVKERDLFAAIRTNVVEECKEYSENIRSLFILVLYQGRMKARDPETTKQLFSVLVKASPADIVFSLLNDDEIKSLWNEWEKLKDKTPLNGLANKLGIEKTSVEQLYSVIGLHEKRQVKSHIILSEAKGDYKDGYTLYCDDSGKEHKVFHDMPRASGRLFNELYVGRVVFELRRSDHPLNNSMDMPLAPFDYLWEQPVKPKALKLKPDAAGIYNKRLIEWSSFKRKLSEMEELVNVDLALLEKTRLCREKHLMTKIQLEEVLQIDAESAENTDLQLKVVISKIKQNKEREDSIRKDLYKEEQGKPIGSCFQHSMKQSAKGKVEKSDLSSLGKKSQGPIEKKLPPMNEHSSMEKLSNKLLQKELKGLSVLLVSLIKKQYELQNSLLSVRKRREVNSLKVKQCNNDLKKLDAKIVEIESRLMTTREMINCYKNNIRAEDEKKFPKENKHLFDFLPLK